MPSARRQLTFDPGIARAAPRRPLLHVSGHLEREARCDARPRIAPFARSIRTRASVARAGFCSRIRSGGRALLGLFLFRVPLATVVLQLIDVLGELRLELRAALFGERQPARFVAEHGQ